MNWLDNVKRFQAPSRKSCTRKRLLERMVKISRTHGKKLARVAVNGRKSAPPTKKLSQGIRKRRSFYRKRWKANLLVSCRQSVYCFGQVCLFLDLHHVCHSSLSATWVWREEGLGNRQIGWRWCSSFQGKFRAKVRRSNQMSEISHSISNERRYKISILENYN